MLMLICALERLKPSMEAHHSFLEEAMTSEKDGRGRL